MSKLPLAAFVSGVGLSLAVVSTAAGCSGGSSTTGADASADGASSSSSGSSGSSSSSGGTLPPPVGVATGCVGPFDISLNGSFGGTGIFRGSATFPQPVELGRIQIYLGPTAQWQTAQVGMSGTGTTAKQTVTFEVKGLATTSKYYVSVVADVNADGQITEADLGGFWDGTLATAEGPWKAKSTTLSAAEPTCADFGVGPIPCFVPWEQACTLVAECAPTVCDCGRASGSRTTNACDGATRLCRRADGDCAAACAGASFVERQGNCIGR